MSIKSTGSIISIPLDELHPFPDHPFGVRDDEAMQQTVESIKEYHSSSGMNYFIGSKCVKIFSILRRM